MPDATARLNLPELGSGVVAFGLWNEALTQLDAVIDMYALEVDLDTPPSSPAEGDTYVIGDAPTDDWIGHMGEIAYWNDEAWTFYAPFNGLKVFVAATSTIVVYSDTVWTAIGSADFATKSGTEVMSNKTFAGGTRFETDGSRIGITSKNTAMENIRALVHVENDDDSTSSFLVTSHWEGSTSTPYTNNDCSLFEVYNSVLSDSLNRSWAGSFANFKNAIPAGVRDGGTRNGIIGWAVSVNDPGNFEHAGTLALQIGVQGTAGFQGSGTPESAIVEQARGVQGFIYNDSAGATIKDAIAGEFISTASTGIVETNVAVYAAAANGTLENWSFFGNGGKFYNLDQILIGSKISQTPSLLSVRKAGNSVEFGHPDLAGYGSSLGALYSSGRPFVAFCAEADPSGNTFRTRGKKGAVISNDLAGALVFSRLTDSNAAAQTPTESGRFTEAGHLQLVETPILPTKTPTNSSATGTTGEVAWDASYIYICVATNSWKRVAIAAW